MAALRQNWPSFALLCYCINPPLTCNKTQQQLISVGNNIILSKGSTLRYCAWTFVCCRSEVVMDWKFGDLPGPNLKWSMTWILILKTHHPSDGPSPSLITHHSSLVVIVTYHSWLINYYPLAITHQSINRSINIRLTKQIIPIGWNTRQVNRELSNKRNCTSPVLTSVMIPHLKTSLKHISVSAYLYFNELGSLELL